MPSLCANFSAKRDLRSGWRLERRRKVRGNGEGKLGAAHPARLDPNPAAVRFDDGAADGQAKTIGKRRRFAKAHAFDEDVVDLLGCDADSVICHREASTRYPSLMRSFTLTWICPPCGANFTALTIRLTSTRTSADASATNGGSAIISVASTRCSFARGQNGHLIQRSGHDFVRLHAASTRALRRPSPEANSPSTKDPSAAIFRSAISSRAARAWGSRCRRGRVHAQLERMKRRAHVVGDHPEIKKSGSRAGKLVIQHRK